jgi:hypothetical protein
MTKEVAVDDVGAREIVLGPYYLEPGPALICISVSTIIRTILSWVGPCVLFFLSR